MSSRFPVIPCCSARRLGTGSWAEPRRIQTQAKPPPATGWLVWKPVASPRAAPALLTQPPRAFQTQGSCPRAPQVAPRRERWARPPPASRPRGLAGQELSLPAWEPGQAAPAPRFQPGQEPPAPGRGPEIPAAGAIFGARVRASHRFSCASLGLPLNRSRAGERGGPLSTTPPQITFAAGGAFRIRVHHILARPRGHGAGRHRCHDGSGRRARRGGSAWRTRGRTSRSARLRALGRGSRRWLARCRGRWRRRCRARRHATLR